MSTKYLKIKIKHLATEPAIIKKEIKKSGRYLSYLVHTKVTKEDENKIEDMEYEINIMRDHLVRIVRTEARATYLAYGYLRGRSYTQIENSQEFFSLKFDAFKIQWARVIAMVTKYGKEKNPEVVANNLYKWLHTSDEKTGNSAVFLAA